MTAEDPRQIEPTMPIATVRRIASQQITELRELGRAVGGSLRPAVDAEVAYRSKYRTLLLQQWTTIGPAALWQQARSHDRPEIPGDATSPLFPRPYAIEWLIQEDMGVDPNGIGRYRSQLEARCHHTPELPAARLRGRPAGVLITASSDGRSLHAFAPWGTDLGPVPLPTGATPPLGDPHASPDGRAISFTDQLSSQRRTWTVDLGTGASSLLHTAWFSPQLGGDDRTIWALGRIRPDGKPAIGPLDDSGLDPARSTPVHSLTTTVFLQRAADGTLLVLDDRHDALATVEPRTGRYHRLPVEKGCTAQDARWNTARTKLAITEHCAASRRSGLYLADERGHRSHQILRAEAFGISWSPNGRWIALDADSASYSPRQAVSLDDTEDRDSLYVVSADGRDRGRVTHLGETGGTWAITVPAVGAAG